LSYVTQTATKAGSTIALQVDGQGNIAYDAIAKRGHSSNQIVQSQFKDLVPLAERADVGEISLSRPSQEEVNATAERTAAALGKISKCKNWPWKSNEWVLHTYKTLSLPLL